MNINKAKKCDEYAGMSSKEIALTNSYNSRLEECERLVVENKKLRGIIETQDNRIGILEGFGRKHRAKIEDMEKALREAEEEEANHTIAYRYMKSQRDDLFRENAILRKKLGCKSCPPGEECYCKPIGGYDGK